MKNKQSIKLTHEPTVEQMAGGLIISVGEARKVLGVESKDLSDNQITGLVLDFEDLAHELLKYKHFAK